MFMCKKSSIADKVDIAVIIPVYNCEKYLDDAIKSVLKQSAGKFIVVLVNDGSTDNSSQICDKWANLHGNIYVIHQENQGVSAARNAGIEYFIKTFPESLIGSYFAFLDSDDKWACNVFNFDTVNLLGRGTSLVGFKSWNCDQQMLKREVEFPLKSGEYFGGTDATGLFLHQQFGAMLYSVQFIKESGIRFKEGLKYAEDRVFLQQALYLANNITLIDRVLYLYRNNPSSAVHKRMSAIMYFEPIFYAYVESDDFLNLQKSGANMGKGYVSWYVIDMIQEHYMQWGKRKEITAWIEQHQDFIQIVSLYGGKRSRDELSKILKHPIMYEYIYKIKGICIRLIRRALKMELIKNRYSKKKYPVDIENEE